MPLVEGGDTLICTHMDRRPQRGGRDIRVNVLSPGYTTTPGLSHFLTEEQRASLIPSVPIGRLGTADGMGKVAVFLASDESACVTGIELFVDGGAAQV
jgi:NAD(P)-dependent dehydrogenase (short-subunit alcohol dehydrogenase family)